MWKLQWLGRAGWSVGGMVGTPKLLRTSFSCQSLFKWTNWSANILRVFLPFNFYGLLGILSGSSQIRVPSKALGVVGSCGWVKRRSAKGQYWLCAAQISLRRFLGIRSFGLVKVEVTKECQNILFLLAHWHIGKGTISTVTCAPQISVAKFLVICSFVWLSQRGQKSKSAKILFDNW